MSATHLAIVQVSHIELTPYSTRSPLFSCPCPNLHFGFLNVGFFFFAVFQLLLFFVVVAALILLLPLFLAPFSSFDINLKLFSFIVADSLAVMDFK